MLNAVLSITCVSRRGRVRHRAEDSRREAMRIGRCTMASTTRSAASSGDNVGTLS
jgi:hypothetical protein